MISRNTKFFISALFASFLFFLGFNLFATGNLNLSFLSGNEKVMQADIAIADIAAPAPTIAPTPDLQISAKAALALRVGPSFITDVLYEKNSGDKLPIASLSKLMTGLVVLSLPGTYDQNQVINVCQEAASLEDSSRYGCLKTGQELSVESLLQIMLLDSNNGAAYALADKIGVGNFVDLMNLFARNIGMTNTSFTNPHGLDSAIDNNPENYSTASDLGKLAVYILRQKPELFQITAETSHLILNPDGTPYYFIPENTNELLGKIPGIVGGKTGFTADASGCLLLVLKDSNGGYFVNIILGSEDRFAEMKKIVQDVDNIKIPAQ